MDSRLRLVLPATALLMTLMLVLSRVPRSYAQATPAGTSTATPTNASAPAVLTDPRFFSQTGFRIADDRFWDYFQRRGGVRTFGYPVSNTFQLLGSPVQIFQRQVVQLRGDGSVGTLNLLDPGLMPYTKINQSTFPGADAVLVASAPVPTSPTYATDVVAFVRAHAPDAYQGLPVSFGKTFFSTVAPQDAFPQGGNASLLPLIDLEMWGVPTSQPAFDPSNQNFVYLRFQRGILQFDKGTGLTQGLLLADYFKAILTGTNLPPDLSAAGAGSRFYLQYNPSSPLGLNRPQDLPGTDLTNAFTPGAVPSGSGPTATPVTLPTATPTAAPSGFDTCVGDEKMQFAGAGNATFGDSVFVTVTSSKLHTNVVLTGPDGPTFLRQRTGQEGYVWDYQVVIKSPGHHDYTFYVDTTTVCTANGFDLPNAVATSTPTPTPQTTNTPTPTPTTTNTPTPTLGPKPAITSVNPGSPGNAGTFVTINGTGFGAQQGGKGAVYFITSPSTAEGGSSPTPGTSTSSTVNTWSDTAIVVQLPTTPGNYSIQVLSNNAPAPSDPVTYVVR